MKIMEIEEYRCLINKKASKDQFMAFFSSFLELSLSLCYPSLILLDAKFSWSTFGRVWHTWDLEQEGKGRARKHKRTSISKTTTNFSCWYRFACMISLLVLAWMVIASGFLVMVYHWQGRFAGLTVVLPSLAISQIAMVLWVLLLFSSWFSCSFGCGLSYQFLEALVGQTLWKPCNSLG